MTLRDPRNGRFISERGYRSLYQPRDASGRFAHEGRSILQPERQPTEHRPPPEYERRPPPEYMPITEEQAFEEEPEEGEEREWVVEVEVRGSYNG